MISWLEKQGHPGFRCLSISTAALLLAVAFSMPTASRFSRGVRNSAPLDMGTRSQAMDNFDVDAGPLPEQLDTILNRHHIVYIYAFGSLEDIRGEAVRGNHSLDDALRIVLRGTRCNHQTLSRFISISCADHHRSGESPLALDTVIVTARE
jgi:hypothetical protein